MGAANATVPEPVSTPATGSVVSLDASTLLLFKETAIGKLAVAVCAAAFASGTPATVASSLCTVTTRPATATLLSCDTISASSERVRSSCVSLTCIRTTLAMKYSARTGVISLRDMRSSAGAGHVEPEAHDTPTGAGQGLEVLMMGSRKRPSSSGTQLDGIVAGAMGGVTMA